MSATKEQTVSYYDRPACELAKRLVREMATKAGIDADAMAREVFNRPVDELTNREAGMVEGKLRKLAPAEESGACFHCGLPNWGDLKQHPWCKEGMSIGEYNRVNRHSF
jgi:hypothetical protein